MEQIHPLMCRGSLGIKKNCIVSIPQRPSLPDPSPDPARRVSARRPSLDPARTLPPMPAADARRPSRRRHPTDARRSSTRRTSTGHINQAHFTAGLDVDTLDLDILNGALFLDQNRCFDLSCAAGHVVEIPALVKWTND